MDDFMDTLQKAASALGKKGGAARAKALSEERRKEIAKKAGEASGAARRLKKEIKEIVVGEAIANGIMGRLINY